MLPATWDIQTPATPGAIAVFRIGGEAREVDEAAALLGLGRVEVGRVVLRDVLGMDTAVVARWTERSLHLMPHGGPAIVRAIAAELERRGLRHGAGEARDEYPEAADEVEARMLRALASAASPPAVDLLLDQPRRWRERGAASSDTHSRLLNRLLDPPLVVAAGPPNVGKSALVNALAGRSVSIVADQPGTTRDHVGVLIDMGGLVVRCVDTPGLGRECDAMEAEAAAIAGRVIESADLVLLCGDATAPPPRVQTRGGVLRVALRSDLGLAGFEHDVATSSLTGWGIPDLIEGIRNLLVPPGVLTDPRPWRFWPGP